MLDATIAAAPVSIDVHAPVRPKLDVKSGLQMSTVRNLLMAWGLALPAAILLSSALF